MQVVKLFKASLKSLSLNLKKHAPEIMVVGGCIGTVGAAVLACKATLKAKDIVDKANEDLDNAKDDSEKTKIKVKAVEKIAVAYIPPVTIGAASILSILGGHHMLKKRHLLTVAALTDTADRFDKYRERVKERLGDIEEQKIITGEHDESVKETVTDPDTGKEKSRNVTKTLLGEDLSGRFHIVMDRGNCYGLGNDFDVNVVRFQIIEGELNEAMREQALFGNGKAIKFAHEVLAELGFKNVDSDWVREHKNMGCVWTKDHPYGVSLGLEEAQRLYEFGVCPDPDEIHLSINFVPNVWDYV